MAMNEKDLGMLMAHIGANIKQWDAAMGQMKRDMEGMEQTNASSMDRINAQLQAVGRQAQQAGMMLSKFVTLPLVGAGTAAFHFGKTFEASMSQIQGLVGASGEQVDEWASQIIALGPQVAKTPQELADALFFVTSAGIRGAEAMDVLTIAAKASSAGLGETKVIADLVTSAMNAYGASNLNAAQAADILTAAVREGKAEAPQLAASMGQVLPIASELGVGFDEVGAAIAAMTRTGTDAATASTQLRAILTTLLSPTDQAEQALSRMGYSSEELRQTLRGPDGLVGVLTVLRQASQGNSAAMAELFPNVRALSGVLDIVGANAEENTAIFESLRNATGSLNTAFEVAEETVEFKWNQALSASTAAMTRFGLAMKEDAVPILQSVTKLLTDLTVWFDRLDDSQRQQILRWGALTAAIGPALVILGTMGTVVLPGLINTARLARAAVLALNSAMLANPYAAVATAVVLLTGYIIQKNRAIERSNELIRETLNMEPTGTRDEIGRIHHALELNEDAIKRLNRTHLMYGTTQTRVYKESRAALEAEREALIESMKEAGTLLAARKNDAKAVEDQVSSLDALIASLGNTNRESTGYGATLKANNDRIQELIGSTGEFTDSMMREVIELRRANAAIERTIELRGQLTSIPDKPVVPLDLKDPAIFDPVIDLELNTAPAEGSIAHFQNRVAWINEEIRQTTSETWRATMMEMREYYMGQIDAMEGLEVQQKQTMSGLVNWGQTAGQVFDRLAFQGERFSSVLKSILRQLAVQGFTRMALSLLGGPSGVVGAGLIPSLSVGSSMSEINGMPALSNGMSMSVSPMGSMSDGYGYRASLEPTVIYVKGEIIGTPNTLRVLIENAETSNERLS